MTSRSKGVRKANEMTTSTDELYEEMMRKRRSKKQKVTKQNLTKELTQRDPERTQRYERGCVSVYFDQFATHLIHWIRQSTMVRGCIAWITEPNVLDAMTEVKGGVQLIVQKETFLQKAKDAYGESLLKRYQSLPAPGKHETNSMWTLGSASNRKQKARLHSKFFVFYDQDKIPFAVWTGSYNVTKCSNRSIENVVVLQDFIMAEWYHKEWLRVKEAAEPLVWS